MNTLLKLIGFFIAATLIHWGLISVSGSWGLSVNFMLVFAAVICVFVKPEYGYPTAFLCGLFLDFFGVRLFGHQALIFTLCASIVYCLENRLDLDSPVPQLIFIFLLEAAAAVGNLILLKLFTGLSAWNGLLPFVGGLILSTLAAPFVFWAVRRAFTYKAKTY